MVEVAEFAAFQTRRGAVPDAVPDSQGLLDLVAVLVPLGGGVSRRLFHARLDEKVSMRLEKTVSLVLLEEWCGWTQLFAFSFTPFRSLFPFGRGRTLSPYVLES